MLRKLTSLILFCLLLACKKNTEIAPETTSALMEPDPAQYGIPFKAVSSKSQPNSTLPNYSTVTLLAKFLGLSTSIPLATPT